MESNSIRSACFAGRQAGKVEVKDAFEKEKADK
jgi:hypothetical protein